MPVFRISHELEKVSDDDRRAIWERNGPDFCQQYFEIKGDEEVSMRLGDHYHVNKDEVFLILSGGGTVYAKGVNTEGEPTDYLSAEAVGPMSVVDVRALTAHAFELRGGTTMVCYSSRPFNPEDMDMHKFALESFASPS